MVAKLRMGKIERVGLASDASNDAITDTPLMVTLDQIRPYELNPRVTRNPRYDEIKASIRERGLDAPPAITRRPGEQHFIIRNGGNTRLAILGELWSETKDERFYRISCLFRPWSDRGEIIALTGHLAENELHGGLSFIERALGVEKARELYEGESGQELSQSELARRLTERQILKPRRLDDDASDVWSIFNRVQENLVKGGLGSRAASGRNQRTRPVHGIDQNVKLNRALWLLADGLRQLKT